MTLLPGRSALTYRGVQVAVPTAWTKDSRACGTPMRDIAYVLQNSPTPACAVVNEQSRDLTEVRLSGNMTGLKPGRTTTKDGRTQIIRHFADRDTTLTVTSPDPALARRYVNAAVPLPGSAIVNGCLVHDPRRRPTFRTEQSGTLLPAGDVTTGSACGYTKGWLDYSVASSRRQATRLAAAFTQAPVTKDVFPTVNPARCAVDTAESTRTYRLNFTIDGEQTQLWIYTNNCRQAAVVNEQGLTAAGPWSLVSHVFNLMWPTFQIDVNAG